MLKKTETMLEVAARSNGNDAEFYRKARIAFERSKPSELHCEQYDWLVGETRRAFHRKCSNASFIKAARMCLIEHMEGCVNGLGVNVYFGTIIHSHWVTTVEAPRLDLKDSAVCTHPSQQITHN